MKDEVEAAFLKLLAYCRACDWAGYEPYDVLNSRFISASPLSRYRLPRLVLTQFLKRSPVNIRPLLGIEKTQNPKALAVFLSAFVKLSRMHICDYDSDIEHLIERLVALRSPEHSYWCWGYSFPWQTRSILVPKGAPNVVCTTFVADAMLDLYEMQGGQRLLEMAESAVQYIINDLYWEDGETVGFCYPLPTSRSRVHNSNLMASALLIRLYTHTGDGKLLEPALKAARYSAPKQLPDGRWPYGEHKTQSWTDNFHTGYNLSAIYRIGKYLETSEFEEYLNKGYEFYKDNFFLKDGSVRYYHNRTYPIDTHCIAQSIITPIELMELDPEGIKLSRSVFNWVMKYMWNNRGYFYYRVLRTCKIRTDYLRWTQAWMFLALAVLLEKETTLAKQSGSNAVSEVQDTEHERTA